MKSLFLVGWVLLALEMVLVAVLLVLDSTGANTVRHGLLRFFGLPTLLFLLMATGLLFWGQRSPSFAIHCAALLFVATPFLLAGGLWTSNLLDSARQCFNADQSGRFGDRHLTAIARAIDRKEYATLEALLKENVAIDWQARDSWDATLFDHAVKRILDDYSGDVSVEGVSLLLANGAPRPDAHVVETVYGGNRAGSIPLLEALLKAGADPNSRDQSGVPLIHFTHAWRSMDKVKLLAKYGANLLALNNRSDRPQWTPLMNAIYMRDWELASYFLAQGAPTEYRTPDGKTAASLLAEAGVEEDNRASPTEGYQQLRKELRQP